MVYSFELLKHANIHYRGSLSFLSCAELSSMLLSLGISCEIRQETLGGSQFLTFECRELNSEELSYLSGHSSLVFMAENVNSLLRPLPVEPFSYLPEDLPEVLKYKGKTGVTFTRMMINTAAALSPFLHLQEPMVFFDPVCGKGTGCFCALTAGMNAVGLDLDRRDIREADDYFTRYLKYHRLKHDRQCVSETFAGKSLPVTVFRFADTKEHYRQNNIRSLTLACADTVQSPVLFRKEKAHIAAADLPYGIQHAPQSGSGTEPLLHFLHRVLPAWKQALKPGGVIAVSFNKLTLPTQDVRNELVRAGFTLAENELFSDLSHEVEHAVVRDVLFAFNTQEESSK